MLSIINETGSDLPPAVLAAATEYAKVTSDFRPFKALCVAAGLWCYVRGSKVSRRPGPATRLRRWSGQRVRAELVISSPRTFYATGPARAASPDA